MVTRRGNNCYYKAMKKLNSYAEARLWTIVGFALWVCNLQRGHWNCALHASGADGIHCLKVIYQFIKNAFYPILWISMQELMPELERCYNI